MQSPPASSSTSEPGPVRPSGALKRRLFIFLVPIGIWLAVSRGGDIGFTPDSVMYWSAARTIHDDGLIATAVPHDPGAVGQPRPALPVIHASNGAARYPLTAWAPGYPIVLAGIMKVTGAAAITAGRVLAFATLVLLSAALLLAASGALDMTRAAFAAALVASLPFVHTTVRMMWSDALFLAVAFVALALAARALVPTPSLPRLLLVAIAAALATYVRYTGPLIMGSVVLAAGILAARRGPWRSLLWKTAVASALFILLILPLFARNLRLIGDFTGMHRPPANEPITWFVAMTLAAFARGFVPWVGGAVPGPQDTLVTGGTSLAMWVIGVGLVGLAIGRTGGLRPPQPAARAQPTALLLVVFAVVYTGALLALRATWKIDFNTRMLLPAVAAAALLLVISFEKRLGDAQLRTVNTVALISVAMATVVSMLAAGYFRRWRGFNEPGYLDRPVAHWTRSARDGAGAPVRLLSTGYLLHYLHLATGAPLDQLPDVPSRALLAPSGTALAIVDPFAAGFRCPEYLVAYQAALDETADSSYSGDGFRAWWLSAAPETRLAMGPPRFTSLCTSP